MEYEQRRHVSVLAKHACLHWQFYIDLRPCRAAECVVCAHPQLPLDICQLLGITALEDIAYENLNEAEPLQYQNIIQVRHLTNIVVFCLGKANQLQLCGPRRSIRSGACRLDSRCLGRATNC